MIKKYDIIPLNNHLYMIDNETIAEGDWVIVGNITAVNHRIEKISAKFLPHVQEIQKIMNSEKFPVKDKVKTVRIIASSDTTLGLPLLPKVEEDGEALSRKLFPESTPEYQRKLWLDGYKAASVKKYTEEDISQESRDFL